MKAIKAAKWLAVILAGIGAACCFWVGALEAGAGLMSLSATLASL